MASLDQDEALQHFMAQCPRCSKDTALTILDLSGNDINKAVEKYQDIEELLTPDPASDDDDTRSQLSRDNSQVDTDSLSELLKGLFDSTDEGPTWMPKVPILPVPKDFASSGPPYTSDFNIREFVGAIQAKQFDSDKVRTYLGYYYKYILSLSLNASIDGCPVMFYIVSTNDVDIIRECIKAGGDPNATWGPDAFPLIAYSILIGGETMLQASQILVTLLRFGADHRVVPKAFYDPYCRDLPEDGPAQSELHDLKDKNKKWCIEEVRACLAKALTLTQRYDLYRSSKATAHSGREKTVLARQGASEVLGLHQMIVAQSIATRWLQRKLIGYLALQQRKPFILVFAGPSGHGKTELARRFGDLMSLELHVVDCTIFKQDSELFGPRPGFTGSEEGSPLNNFLVRKAGQRCIVFMDEFEKTSKEIHNTLLLPFQDGRYEDRRNGTTVDCSKTIWVLATNQLDDSIHAFCKANEKVLLHSEDSEAQDKLVAKLCGQLRKEFRGHFNAPLAGRITEILPFLVFAQQEAAVIAHKALMDLETQVARRIRLSLNREEDVYVGNVQIRVKSDATVCSTIARDEYDKTTGARSIAQAMERIIQDPLVSQYLKDGDEFDEHQPPTRFEIGVNVDGEVEVRLVPFVKGVDEEDGAWRSR